MMLGIGICMPEIQFFMSYIVSTPGANQFINTSIFRFSMEQFIVITIMIRFSMEQFIMITIMIRFIGYICFIQVTIYFSPASMIVHGTAILRLFRDAALRAAGGSVPGAF